MQISFDGVVHALISKTNVAIQLLLGDLLSRKRKRHGTFVGRLTLKSGPIDRAPVEARRCTSLKTSHAEPQPFESLSEFNGSWFPRSAAGVGATSRVYLTVEKCTGGRSEERRVGKECRS